jgi:hypothetical protein
MNKEAIEKCKVETVVQNYADGLQSREFKRWYEQIKRDFGGEVLEFRDAVLKTANAMLPKKKGETLEQCVGFILEECAYACTYFKNINMVYPVPSMAPMVSVFERYKLNVRQLTYKLSKHMEEHKYDKELFEKDKIKEVLFEFITEKVTNVNFFIINREGKQIYKNYALDREIGEVNAKEMPPPLWENTVKVIKSKQQFTFEEKNNGKYYLSVKAPLIIDGRAEGILGLAIDITDRKKNEQLVKENELQKLRINLQNKIRDIFEKFVRSIQPVLTELCITARNNKNLTEEERIDITSKAIGIQSIINELLISLQENKLDNLKL